MPIDAPAPPVGEARQVRTLADALGHPPSAGLRQFWRVLKALDLADDEVNWVRVAGLRIYQLERTMARPVTNTWPPEEIQ